MNTFVGGKGDVLLAYENEAIQAQQAGADIAFVRPSATLLIENPIAVLKNTQHATEAKAFVDFTRSARGAEHLGRRTATARSARASSRSGRRRSRCRSSCSRSATSSRAAGPSCSRSSSTRTTASSSRSRTAPERPWRRLTQPSARRPYDRARPSGARIVPLGFGLLAATLCERHHPAAARGARVEGAGRGPRRPLDRRSRRPTRARRSS